MSCRRATVTLCMIVRNEERNLGDCLRGVAPLFDEIVIVDTGSTDRTRAIAESFGAKVFEFPWKDDFAAARNASLEHAGGDWVFWLDADDRISSDNVRKLSALFDGLDHAAKSYVMNTRCLPAAAADPVMLVNHPRLFRRHPSARWSRRVHEQILPALMDLRYETAWSDVLIDHVGYQDEAVSRRKHQRNLRLLQLENLAYPDDPFVLFHMGMTVAATGAAGRAIELFQKSLALTREIMPYTRKTFAMLAMLLWDSQRREEAQSVIRSGLTYFADDIELLIIQAEMAASLGQWTLAETALRRLMTLPPANYFHLAVPDDICSKSAPRELAAVLGQQGRFDEAESVLRELLEKHPDYVFGWVCLGQLGLVRQQWAAVAEVIRRIEKLPGGEPYVAGLLAEAYLAQGNVHAAEPWLDRAVALAPAMPWPRMLRVRWLELIQARPETRLAAVQDLLRLAPGDLFAQQALAAISQSPAQETPTQGLAGSSIVVQSCQPAT